MTEAISAHKKMAMGITEGNVMKKGGKVRRYANGGRVMPEKGVDTLINKNGPLKPAKSTGTKLATMKSGGPAKKGMGLTIMIGAPMKRSVGRGK